MNKLKILIADDVKPLAELAKNFIEKESNKFEIVDLAKSSKEEMEMIEKYTPDIVITDVERKGEDISGFDIILKCLAEEKNVNFILYTASTREELLYKYKQDRMPSNVICFLKKPFDWDYLVREVEQASLPLFEKINSSDGWKEDYYNNKYINLFEELTEDDMYILRKLDIHIEKKSYSKYEFDIIKQKFGLYYNENEDEPEEREYKKSLDDVFVSNTEYNKVLEKFDEIDNKYVYKK